MFFFGRKGKIHLQKSKTSCIGIGTTNRFKEMGFISQVLQVVSRKGFNLFLLRNNIRGFVTWHSSLWALSEPLMISTALAGTREKQRQMKMKVSRNVEVWFYFLNERQVCTMPCGIFGCANPS